MHQATDLESLIDDLLELVDVERFYKVIECTTLHSVNCGVGISMPGDENDQ
jgi:hypothetical protein